MVKKIDFHIHTVATEKDYPFSYSSKWMKEYVKEARLDAVAITNHDLFDLQNYCEIKKDLPNIQVFPGMELSLEQGHVNIIFSENEISHLVNFSEWIQKQNLGARGKISVDDYCDNMT
ncbi:MAG: PHP domain-containing protein, partial [Lactococcus cremoris]